MNALLRYIGYKNTEQLWHDELFDIKQYRLNPQKEIILQVPAKFLRLGQLVEHFLFSEMNTNSDIEIIEQNIQVIENKITIGELDCLILDNHKPASARSEQAKSDNEPKIDEADGRSSKKKRRE